MTCPVLRAFATMALVLIGTGTMAIQVQISGANPTCGNNTGYAIAQVIGGAPPYTYAWSNGATTDTIMGLPPGTYSVTVTDSNSDQATNGITLGNMPNPVLDYLAPAAGLHGCHGQCNNGFWYYEELMPMNLVPPFTFSNPPTYGVDPNDILRGAWLGFCDDFSGNFTTVTDGLGCVAQLYVPPGMLQGSDPGPMVLVSTTPSCENMSAGSMMVNVGYEYNSAYTPHWNATLLNESMQPVPGHPLFATPIPDQNIELETGLPPGDYHVERRFFHYQGDCVDLLPVTIPSLGTDCGAVSGSAYMDYNENCQNNGEPAVPTGIIEVMPGPVYTSLVNGSYILCLVPGDYTLEQISGDVVEHCTGAPIPFTITPSTIPVQVHLPDTSSVPLDLATYIATGPARPGFQFDCGIHIQNTTPNASGAITLTMVFDAILGYLSADPLPSNVTGNTITWNLPQVTGWQTRSVDVHFNVPADPGLIGTQLLNSVSVSSVNTDGDLLNNSASASTTITGSYDPNDKLANTSLGSSSTWIIDQDEWVDYTIRFQNTGTDTAFNILITDTLPNELDAATIQIGAGSHAFTWELRDQGTLKFHFQNILLPDSNYNEPMSHGFVGFRIRPHGPLLPGQEIENIANIYFDFNPPVITEPCVLIAATNVGSFDMDHGALLQVHPQPSNGMVWIEKPLNDLRSVRILSIDGRVVRSIQASPTQTSFDLGQLASGRFLMEFHHGQGDVKRARLQIVH